MNKKIETVVWFNTSLHQSGGGERLSLESIRCFREMGLRAFYITFKYRKEKVFEAGYHHDDIIAMDNGEEGKPSGFWGQVLWLRGVLKRIKPDRVITQGTWRQVIFVYWATLFTKMHYDVHIYGSLFAFPPSMEKTKYALVFKSAFKKIRDSQPSYSDTVPEKLRGVGLPERLRLEINSFFKYLAVRAARRIFVLSQRNRWEVQQLYRKDSAVLKGAFPKRMLSFVPDLDLKKRYGVGAKNVVLTISRLAVNKRIDLCIKAFAELDENYRKKSVLVIGGKGAEENNLRELASKLRLQEQVIFIGYVPDNELWDHFAMCDVFVHLDLADFDIAPFEALSLGQKVIWAEEMEIDEPLRGNPHLFPVRPTVESVANGMKSALSAKLSRSDKEVIRRIVETYTWENYTYRMLNS